MRLLKTSQPTGALLPSLTSGLARRQSPLFLDALIIISFWGILFVLGYPDPMFDDLFF
jgi:hypothetical protein